LQSQPTFFPLAPSMSSPSHPTPFLFRSFLLFPTQTSCLKRTRMASFLAFLFSFFSDLPPEPLFFGAPLHFLPWNKFGPVLGLSPFPELSSLPPACYPGSGQDRPVPNDPFFAPFSSGLYTNARLWFDQFGYFPNKKSTFLFIGLTPQCSFLSVRDNRIEEMGASSTQPLPTDPLT